MESKKLWSKKRLIVGALLLVLIGIMWASDLHKCLSFNQIKTNAVWLHDQVEYHYCWSVMVYMSAFILVVICSLPGVSLMNMLGGFLFGVLNGIFFVNIAATIGATIFFLLMRYVIGSFIQERYAIPLTNFNQMIEKKGWLFLLAIRCMPVIPFFMVNMFAALTQIRLSTFIWTTSVGILPTSIIFAYAGKQLNGVSALRDLFSVPVLGSLGMLIVLVVIPLAINRYRKIF